MKKKRRVKKLVKKGLKKTKRKSPNRIGKFLQKFLKKNTNKSKYKSVFTSSSPPVKTTKSKSKFKSILKEGEIKKLTSKERFKQARQLQILNDFKKGNFQKLSRQDYLDDKILRDIRRRKKVDLNTAQYRAALEKFESQLLSSSWITQGKYEFFEKDGIWTVTITIVKRLAKGMLRTYNYTYFVKEKKAWEEMKAAAGAFGSGAGTVFWKYYKKGIIYEDKSLVLKK